MTRQRTMFAVYFATIVVVLFLLHFVQLLRGTDGKGYLDLGLPLPFALRYFGEWVAFWPLALLADILVGLTIAFIGAWTLTRRSKMK